MYVLTTWKSCYRYEGELILDSFYFHSFCLEFIATSRGNPPNENPWILFDKTTPTHFNWRSICVQTTTEEDTILYNYVVLLVHFSAWQWVDKFIHFCNSIASKLNYCIFTNTMIMARGVDRQMDGPTLRARVIDASHRRRVNLIVFVLFHCCRAHVGSQAAEDYCWPIFVLHLYTQECAFVS